MIFLPKKPVLNLLFLFGGIVLGLLIIVLFLNYKSTGKFLSPLGANPDILATRIPSKKPIIGFLPYWNLNNADIKYHLLDYLAYFSISLNSNGSIKTKEDQNMEIGHYKLKSNTVAEIFNKAKKSGVKTMIVISVFDNEIMDNILNSPINSQNAINNIVNLVKEYNFDGVNIDFEYNTNNPINANSYSQYPLFIKNLKQQLNQNTGKEIYLTLDLYANAFILEKYYNSYELSQNCDGLVLMGYDFFQTSSTKAGPVAPIKSEISKSISQALDSAITKKIETQKVILAIPFYGYEWQTTNTEFNSPTYPGSGAMASYKRVSQLIEEEDNLQTNWDNSSMSPWLSYEINGMIKQIYYENDQSIGYKLQLANQVNLQGIAIWALGYEGKDASVWKVIEDWRKNQK